MTIISPLSQRSVDFSEIVISVFTVSVDTTQRQLIIVIMYAEDVTLAILMVHAMVTLKNVLTATDILRVNSVILTILNWEHVNCIDIVQTAEFS